MSDDIIGQKIKTVRRMTAEELEAEGWDGNEPVMVLELANGRLIYPSMDFEGNGGGALFTSHKGQTGTIFI